MVGLNVKFYKFIIATIGLLLTIMVGTSIGLFLGFLILSLQKAVVYSSILILASMLVGGYLVNQDNMPVWIRWCQWTSPVKYAFEIFMLNDLYDNDVDFEPSNPSGYDTSSGEWITGREVLD